MPWALLYPNGYICDGKVDCPKQLDEIKCSNRICIGLFSCFHTSQCIYLSDVCNDIKIA